MSDADVVIVGLGGGGAVVAHRLAAAGFDVVALEAGPWLDPDDDYTMLEDDMGSMASGRLRWGPRDRSRPPWNRKRDGVSLVLQAAGVGGTTRHYNAIAARAHRASIDDVWPMTYDDLVPWYELVESFLPVQRVGVLAPKDERFAAGCRAIGLPERFVPDIDVTSWGHSHNAILDTDGDAGCTWCGHCLIGCRNPAPAPLVEKAKRSTDVAYVPAAVATGRCRIVPDAFATAVLHEEVGATTRAVGVRYRSTETGESSEVRARVVVLAGGSIETPRLWLSSGLPDDDGVVGRYLTNHYQDFVVGFFDDDLHPDVGPVTMAVADFPGLGRIWSEGVGPWGFSVALAAAGTGTWQDDTTGEPWDTTGRSWGTAAIRRIGGYHRSLMIAISTDDESSADNRITLAEDWPPDEHGLVASIRYEPTRATVERQLQLARTASEILRAAGAHDVHRVGLTRGVMAHIMGTMRMGADARTSVVDAGGAAHHVAGLYVADSSVLPNGVGGVPPTLTTQALAERTAASIIERSLT